MHHSWNDPTAKDPAQEAADTIAPETERDPGRMCHDLFRQPPEGERRWVRSLDSRHEVAQNARAFTVHRLTGITTEALDNPGQAAETMRRAAGRLVLAAERLDELAE